MFREGFEAEARRSAGDHGGAAARRAEESEDSKIEQEGARGRSSFGSVRAARRRPLILATGFSFSRSPALAL